MVLLENPYVSPEMLEYLIDSGEPVLENEMSLRLGLKERGRLIDREQMCRRILEGERVYTNSENALEVIYEELPDSRLAAAVELMKDKAGFRQKLSPLYPDFYYRVLRFSELSSIRYEELHVPFVLKPAVGFFSIGVYPVENERDWDFARNEIERLQKVWQRDYPDSVVKNSVFLIEEYIGGEEYALDAYYDETGKPVILNLMKHDFASSQDVGDRLYYTGKSLFDRWLDPFTEYLAQVNRCLQVRNFPLHAEIRVTEKGIVPIEFNPLRFAGWCVTDLTWFSFGLRTYDYYLRNRKPDWERLLDGRDNRLYTMMLLNKPEDARPTAVFDYDRLCRRFEKVLHVRPITDLQAPVYGFLFAETDANDRRELDQMLRADMREYLT